MSKSPEKELEEFLTPLPAWLRMVIELDFSSFPQDKLSDWMNYDLADHERLKQEYERILQRSPHEWQKYRKRAGKHRAMLASQMVPMPQGKSGRRPDNKAEGYVAQHSSKSYRQMAKEELQGEPEGEAKKLLVEKERERIRQSVSRSRRRKNT